MALHTAELLEFPTKRCLAAGNESETIISQLMRRSAIEGGIPEDGSLSEIPTESLPTNILLFIEHK